MKTPDTADLGRALRALAEYGDQLVLFVAIREQVDDVLRDLDHVEALFLALATRAGLDGPALVDGLIQLFNSAGAAVEEQRAARITDGEDPTS